MSYWTPAGKTTAAEIVTSQVTFKELSESEVTAYLATGEPFDKAGAYAIQGKGRDLVAQVSGSHTNVIGLPMDEVTTALRIRLVCSQRSDSRQEKDHG